MAEIIRVGMAEFKIAHAPDKLVSLGLGSCVGICAYDAMFKLGGLIHIMLPNSYLAVDSTNPAKFADTGIPLMIQQLEEEGAALERLIIKIIGGAEMFLASGQQLHLGVGERNILAVEETCRKMNLEIRGKSVGGTAGKSVTLDLDTGLVEIKSMNQISIL